MINKYLDTVNNKYVMERAQNNTWTRYEEDKNNVISVASIRKAVKTLQELIDIEEYTIWVSGVFESKKQKLSLWYRNDECKVRLGEKGEKLVFLYTEYNAETSSYEEQEAVIRVNMMEDFEEIVLYGHVTPAWTYFENMIDKVIIRFNQNKRRY